MKKTLFIIFLLFVVSLIALAFGLYLYGCKDFANFLLGILTAVGTCGVVLYAVYEMIPKKEMIVGYYSSSLYPDSLALFLNNTGDIDVVLSEDCVVEIISTDGKESFRTNKLKHRVILPKGAKRKEVVFAMKKGDGLRIAIFQAMYENNVECHITTEKGTVIKLEEEKSKK